VRAIAVTARSYRLAIRQVPAALFVPACRTKLAANRAGSGDLGPIAPDPLSFLDERSGFTVF